MRRKPLSIVLLGALIFLSQSAVASDSSGSALSGVGIEPILEIDERGLSTLRDARHRSPSGILYPYPLRPEPWAGEQIQLRTFVELGYVGDSGETEEADFRKYADRSDGFLLRRFLIEGREPTDAGYFEIGGGSVGRSDQFYRAEFGYFGLVRFRGSFDSLKHFSMDDARVLFGGVGSEQLTLPAPLVPGLNTASDVEAALANIGTSNVSQTLQKGRFDLRWRIIPDLTVIADYQHSGREGEKAFGGTLGVTFGSELSGSVAETIVPVESDTQDWSLALQYAEERFQINLRYRGSAYDNHNDSLTWENPFAALDLTGFGLGLTQGVPRGRAALEPDNQLHQISADIGIGLPLAGRLTMSASWTRMRQNQRLMPATINPTVPVFDDLSRTHADARVDHLLIQSKVRLKPLRSVTLQLKFRFVQRDNDTKYLSLNPSNGIYGYVVEDGTATNRVGAVPFSTKNHRATGEIEWRFAKRSRAGIEFDYEATQRNNRARREIRDQRIRVHASTGQIPHTQIRIAYSFRRRSGSSYDTARDGRFYASAPGLASISGPEFSLQEFRQLDLASHDRHEVNLRANWLLGDRTDFSIVARYDVRDFRPAFGVTKMRVAETTADLSFQLSPRLIAHGFASFEWRDQRMVTINSALAPRTDLTAGSPLFPFANRWSWDSDSRSITVGAGWTVRPTSKLDLELDYLFQRSHEVVDTEFSRAGGALPANVDPATAASRFPSLRRLEHIVESAAIYHWSEGISTRLFYRYQYTTIQDYHQQGLQPVLNHNLFLGHVDDDYSVHVMAFTVRLRY